MVLFKIYSPPLDVMSGYPNVENYVYPKRIKKEPEMDIGALRDTVRDEWTMVIEEFHARIALLAVNCAPRPHYIAREAVLKLRN